MSIKELILSEIEKRTGLRKFILFLFDILLCCPISIFLSFYILKITWNDYINFFILYTILAGALFLLTGKYKGITRFIGSAFVYNIASTNFLLSAISLFVFIIFKFNFPYLNFLIIQWLSFTVLLSSYRFALRDLYLQSSKFNSKNSSKKVAIYGSGAAGRQLYLSLKYSSKYEVLFFVDDARFLHGRYLNGIKIISFANLKKECLKIDQVLIAIPSLSSNQLNSLILKLQKLKLPIYTIPSIEDLNKRTSKIDYLRPIDVEDILRRDSVKPNTNLLKNSIEEKVICVTGGGGSIGSELCKQIINLRPRLLILIEKSEFNLYQIEKAFKDYDFEDSNYKLVLNDCLDTNFLKKIFKKYSVQVVFHAAAYKHVPIVENNAIEGIKNNVFSTLAICNASIGTSVEKFLLVSSDKAVRPSNIMGASKRLSELIVQAFAEKVKEDNRSVSSTCFSMVRFGNVLNSSGSVVPLFNEQISKGGPITITHSEIIRYFMTIKEAAELMLQASSMSKGGELFLLDMGSPVKIVDLAKQMIRLSGLKLKDKNNTSGDIAITFTGLRKGEKLYEELLIDAQAIKTEHPLIYKAKEFGLPFEILMEELEKLDKEIKDLEEEKVFRILSKLVPEWKENTHK